MNKRLPEVNDDAHLLHSYNAGHQKRINVRRQVL